MEYISTLFRRVIAQYFYKNVVSPAKRRTWLSIRMLRNVICMKLAFDLMPQESPPGISGGDCCQKRGTGLSFPALTASRYSAHASPMAKSRSRGMAVLS